MIAPYFGLKNPISENAELIDFSKIESLDECKEVIRDAGVIWAVDVNGQGQQMVFGIETLRAIAAEVIPAQELRVTYLAVDFATSQVEYLLAAVAFAKGYYVWNEKIVTLSK